MIRFLMVDLLVPFNFDIVSLVRSIISNLPGMHQEKKSLLLPDLSSKKDKKQSYKYLTKLRAMPSVLDVKSDKKS
jgi:hypothetical protein